jgi:hypothetical protein
MCIIIYSLTLFSLLSLYYRIDNQLLLLYGFSVLRFFGDFEKCMAVEPQKRWTESKHPFVQRVTDARKHCNIEDPLFELWQTDAINSFKSRNAYGMIIGNIADGPIESRTMIGLVQCMVKVVQSHGVTLNIILDRINDSGGILQKVEHKVDDVMARFQNLNLGSGQQQQQQQEEDAPAEAITLSSYSDLMRTGKEMPVQDIAFNWFRYNARQLFCNEKSQVKTKKEGNRLRQHFSSIKSTMHVLIKNLNNYSVEMPSDPSLIVPWERSLKSQVEAALETIQPLVKAMNKNNVKALVTVYNEQAFPEGTPDEVKVFFNDKGRNQSGRRKRSADESVASESNTNKSQRSN